MVDGLDLLPPEPQRPCCSPACAHLRLDPIYWLLLFSSTPKPSIEKENKNCWLCELRKGEFMAVPPFSSSSPRSEEKFVRRKKSRIWVPLDFPAVFVFQITVWVDQGSASAATRARSFVTGWHVTFQIWDLALPKFIKPFVLCFSEIQSFKWRVSPQMHPGDCWSIEFDLVESLFLGNHSFELKSPLERLSYKWAAAVVFFSN